MAPIDDLTDDCINFIKTHGSNSKRVSDIINNKDKIVYDLIEKGLFYFILFN